MYFYGGILKYLFRRKLKIFQSKFCVFQTNNIHFHLSVWWLLFFCFVLFSKTKILFKHHIKTSLVLIFANTHTRFCTKINKRENIIMQYTKKIVILIKTIILINFKKSQQDLPTLIRSTFESRSVVKKFDPHSFPKDCISSCSNVTNGGK